MFEDRLRTSKLAFKSFSGFPSFKHLSCCKSSSFFKTSLVWFSCDHFEWLQIRTPLMHMAAQKSQAVMEDSSRHFAGTVKIVPDSCIVQRTSISLRTCDLHLDFWRIPGMYLDLLSCARLVFRPLKQLVHRATIRLMHTRFRAFVVCRSTIVEYRTM